MGLNDVLHKVRATFNSMENSNNTRFSFLWAGIRFHGCLAAGEQGSFTIALEACLCKLPFRAENAEARGRLADLVRTKNLSTGTYRLGSRGEVAYASKTHIPSPLSAALFALAVVVTLMSLRPTLLSFRAAAI